MTTLQEAARKALASLELYDHEDFASCKVRHELRIALAQQELRQKERPDFMAGYDAGMADAKRMAQQGEPVAQARLGMQDGLAMALSVVELYGMKGDVIYREIAKLRDGIAPAPQAQEPTAWRTEALKWIRRKAEDQRAANEQNPRHAEAYPSWGERVRQWHWLADELELEQNSTSFGLEPYQEPAPQPAQEEPTGCACRWDEDDNRVATCARHQGWLDVVGEWYERAKAAEAAMQTAQPVAQDVAELVDALEKLARLGNGEHYGNSDGNMIARDALSKYKGAK